MIQEQKESIIKYSERHNLKIIDWFEELETAAKSGRPLFTKMVKKLKAKKADGVIIHKIDRSARNLKDWALLGDLIDEGYDIHFAHESLDLNQRGGRLAADIQAVIASDYIRNLREETIKGLYGRLKQGIYPFKAPPGYINKGSGQVKEIDPVVAPLITKAFNLYATEKYNLEKLALELNKYGLKNLNGKNLRKNSLSKILNNPFYTGVLKVKGKSFIGNHTPIVTAKLFNQVKSVLKGKVGAKIVKHRFVFSKMIKCNICNYSLIAEKQKGHTYYRCHSKGCITKGLREEVIERILVEKLDQIKLHKIELEVLNELLEKAKESKLIKEKDILESLKLKEIQLNLKIEKLTDAYIENMIDKIVFEEKKQKVLIEKNEIETAKRSVDSKIGSIYNEVQNFLELLKTVKESYTSGNYEEKRKILKTITSNLMIEGKKLIISLQNPFYDISIRDIVSLCDSTENRTLIPSLRRMCPNR